MAIFDLDTPKSFFDLIERRWQHCTAGSHKHTEDILFVILGINHLREWIAPKYKPKWVNDEPIFPGPGSPEQEFSKNLYITRNHSIIRDLCNGLKHTDPKHAILTSYNLPFDEWDDFDSVQSVDNGPPSGFSVDGTSVDDIIEAVLKDYRDWFTHP